MTTINVQVDPLEVQPGDDICLSSGQVGIVRDICGDVAEVDLVIAGDLRPVLDTLDVREYFGSVETFGGLQGG